MTATLAILLVCAHIISSLAAWPFNGGNPPVSQWYPPTAILNVKTNSSIGAKGDGKTDDTRALQLALNVSHQYEIIYIPQGTYLISEPLACPTYHGGVASRKYLQGERPDKVTIQLKDNSKYFSDPVNPVAMFECGHGVAQSFSNFVMGLTFSTGSGNPGASGLRFQANNLGAIRDVAIFSGDGQGAAALDMAYSDQIGPLLVSNLWTRGFDFGFITGHNVDSQTGEHWLIEAPRNACVANYGQVLSLRGLDCKATQTAIGVLQDVQGQSNIALTTLIDSSIQYHPSFDHDVVYRGTISDDAWPLEPLSPPYRAGLTDAISVSTPNATVPAAINGTHGMWHVRNVTVQGYDYSVFMDAVWNGPPPPPPACVNCTQFQGIQLEGTNIFDSNGHPPIECCMLCHAWNHNASRTSTCSSWQVLNDPSTDHRNSCYLHDSTDLSATKNPVATASGILDNVYAPAQCKGSTVVKDKAIQGKEVLELSDIPHSQDQCCAACHAFNRRNGSSTTAAPNDANCTAWSWLQDVFPIGYPPRDKHRFYNSCMLYSSVSGTTDATGAVSGVLTGADADDDWTNDPISDDMASGNGSSVSKTLQQRRMVGYSGRLRGRGDAGVMPSSRGGLLSVSDLLADARLAKALANKQQLSSTKARSLSDMGSNTLGSTPVGPIHHWKLQGQFIDEWLSHPVLRAFNDSTTPNVSLRLPIRDTPYVPLETDSKKWASGVGQTYNISIDHEWAMRYNCSLDEVHRPNSSSKWWIPDCSAILKEVLASNPDITTINFPPKRKYPDSWQFYEDVSIPRNIQRMTMAGTQVAGGANFTVEEGDENDPPLVFESWYTGYTGHIAIWHKGRRPIVLRDVEGVEYRADCEHGTPGDVFISDFVGPNMTFCKGQKVWARQLDLENHNLDVMVKGKGTTAWILGFKTENGAGGLLNATDGAAAEVLGTFAYSTLRPQPLLFPYFAVTNGARMSVTMREYAFDCNPAKVPFYESRLYKNGTVVDVPIARNFSLWEGLIPGYTDQSCPTTFTSGAALFVGFHDEKAG